MNETSNSWLAATGTSANPVYSGTIGTTTVSNINGYSGSPITNITDGSRLTVSGNSSYSISNSISNLNNMNKQVKVAVFTVERNKDNKVTSSTFVKEIWVEVKNGASLELSVAKHLDKDFDPSTTTIREIYSFTF